MHALQLLPLAAILLELAARRVPPLRRPAVRLGVVRVLVALYLGTVAVVTVQALSGESIVAPSAPTILASVALWAAAFIAVGITLAMGSRVVAASEPDGPAASVAR
jgi:hypothetical protein